jgi:hypothetical protein
LWILPGVAFLCVAWIFFLRWQENRQIEQQAIQKKRAEDRQSVEMLGGDRFEILQFYAAPGFIRRGESAQLCYGVSQAKSVRLEPQSPPVWPSFSRCVYVAPVRDTTYTLTAEDAEGRRKTATVIVHVR